MAISTCLKCAGHSFELAMLTPMGESHKTLDRSLHRLRNTDWRPRSHLRAPAGCPE